ncbi:lipoprotein [Candidatus Kinetoplastibacterium blastocrithidii (ex Strigomonas culicis)]|nr:lipoprotein [Candidatus Kinetoplastibacterium blastocrithidii (ex Strigomonas culicis)]
MKQLYELSKEEINRKNWKLAKYYINKITDSFSTEIIYQDALIDLIYINWQEGKYQESLSQISNFQKLYPRNPRIDHLLYIRGLINSTMDKSLFDLIKNEKTLLVKDNKKIISALQDFNEIITKFPDSKYSAQSRENIEVLNNMLAKNELNIAKYYYDNKILLAAINRAKKITEQTNNIYYKEASEIIEKSYHILSK